MSKCVAVYGLPCGCSGCANGNTGIAASKRRIAMRHGGSMVWTCMHCDHKVRAPKDLPCGPKACLSCSEPYPYIPPYSEHRHIGYSIFEKRTVLCKTKTRSGAPQRKIHHYAWVRISSVCVPRKRVHTLQPAIVRLTLLGRVATVRSTDGLTQVATYREGTTRGDSDWEPSSTS